MLEIKNPKMSYGINFPTNLKELTPEILNYLTESIKLPKHYAIVVMAYETKIFDLVMQGKSNKQGAVKVTPILAKIDEVDGKTLNLFVGEKLVVDRSSLERGVHVNLPTMINSANVANYLLSDNDFVNKIITNKTGDNNHHQDVIVIEAKIIPVNDISAGIDASVVITDPFIKYDKTKDN